MVKTAYKTAADLIGAGAETKRQKKQIKKERKLGIGPSSQGGEAYRVPDEGLTRFTRFLILGSDAGSFYASPEKLTADNTKAIRATLDADPDSVNELLRVASNRLAPKTDAIMFALALATRSKNEATRRNAYAAIPRVCGTASQLYEFLNLRFALGGVDGGSLVGKKIKNAKDDERYGNHASSAGLRRALTNWIDSRSAPDFAYQLMKYPQREGVSMRDVLRIARPGPFEDARMDALAHYAVKGDLYGETRTRLLQGHDPDEIWARLHAADNAGAADVSAEHAASLIRTYNLPREVVRTDLLNEIEIWEALLQDMPMTAMLRNLGVMESKGVLQPLQNRKLVIDRLTDAERMRKARLHPINIFTALSVYQQGHGVRSSLTWTPNPRLIDALQDGFDLSFASVTPSNKKILVAIDISGSMGALAYEPSRSSAAELSGVMATVLLRSEPDVTVIGVDHQVKPLALSGKMRPTDVADYMHRNMGGATDLTVPFDWIEQQKNGSDYEAIVLFTDSENGAYRYHLGYGAQMQKPRSLREYQEQFIAGRPERRMILAQMVANNQGWVHPSGKEWDQVGRQSLEIVGFDPTIGKLTADFLTERF